VRKAKQGQRTRHGRRDHRGGRDLLLILENMIQSDLLTTRVLDRRSENQRRLEVLGNLLVNGVTLEEKEVEEKNGELRASRKDASSRGKEINVR